MLDSPIQSSPPYYDLQEAIAPNKSFSKIHKIKMNKTETYSETPIGNSESKIYYVEFYDE